MDTITAATIRDDLVDDGLELEEAAGMAAADLLALWVQHHVGVARSLVLTLRHEHVDAEVRARMLAMLDRRLWRVLDLLGESGPLPEVEPAGDLDLRDGQARLSVVAQEHRASG